MAQPHARSARRAHQVFVEQTRSRHPAQYDSPDQIFLFDEQGRYTRLSGKATDTEANAEYLTTDVWRAWGISDDQLVRFNQQRESVFHTGQAVSDELTRPGTNHEYVLSPLGDERGKIHTVVATVRDTTHRTRSEERLRFLADASKILDSSLDTTTTLTNIAYLAVPYLADACVIHVLDAEGTVQQIAGVYVDQETEARALELREEVRYAANGMFGAPVVLRTGASVLYRTITDEHVHTFSDDAAQIERLRRLMPKSAMIVPITARGKLHGTVSFALASSDRRYTSTDLALAEDLAHRAALAMENARLYEDAQKAIRLRDDFFSIASHELRSPLTVLQLQIDGMLRSAQNGVGPALAPDLLAKKLQTSKRQVQRIARLLDDLLDVSQIASGRLDLDLGSVDLGDVVRDVVAASEEQAALAGSPITTHLQPDVIGRWDDARVEQVVINLVSNAIKYSNAKPIDVYVESNGTMATLVVRDGGIGIPAADIGRIFDRFERAASSRGYEGMGLGLYIVKQIVRALGGTIEATSILGEGSTFTVELPLHPSATEAPLSAYA